MRTALLEHPSFFCHRRRLASRSVVSGLLVIKKSIAACAYSKKLYQQARELEEVSQETIIESTKLVRKSERLLLECEKNRSRQVSKRNVTRIANQNATFGEVA